MLRRVGVGPHREPDVVGHVRAGGEDLGPVDDVLVAVATRPGPQRGQVGARLGLGVADGEIELAREDLREEERFLLLRAVAHDGRTHRVDRDEGKGSPGAPRLVEEDELIGRRPALPTELGRPADSEPAVLADPPDHLTPGVSALPGPRQPGPHLFGEQVGVVPAQVGAQLPLVGTLFEEHRRAASRTFRRSLHVKAASAKTVTRSRLGFPGAAAGSVARGRRYPAEFVAPAPCLRSDTRSRNCPEGAGTVPVGGARRGGP